jgi:predicted permease
MTWLFLRDPKHLTAKEQAELELICHHSPTATVCYQLAQQFMSMLRLRRGQQLDAWLSAVEASQVDELRRFAEGLLKDKSAVVAGLTLSYSNGPVEAQVHKRETWSSAPCLAAPNFLSYANAYSMLPDLQSALGHREFFCLCFLFLLGPLLSPTPTRMNNPSFMASSERLY